MYFSFPIPYFPFTNPHSPISSYFPFSSFHFLFFNCHFVFPFPHFPLPILHSLFFLSRFPSDPFYIFQSPVPVSRTLSSISVPRSQFPIPCSSIFLFSVPRSPFQFHSRQIKMEQAIAISEAIVGFIDSLMLL